MKSKLIISILILLALNADSFSQRKNIKSLIEAYGQNAQIYFLAANRPSYGVSSYTIGKGNLELSAGVSIAEDFYEVPLDITYGISKNLDIFGGINAFTHSYDFEENTANGIGDSRFGIRYKFQESDFFSHAVQSIIKIPTANSENDLGTGKVDLHFGVGQSYYAKYFGYDASIELNMLQRKDMPGTNSRLPKKVRDAIDSVNQIYDYTFEPEIGISFSPAIYPASNVYVYTGIAFTRNTKLDYNTTNLYAGTGFSPSNLLSFGLGGSYGLEEGGSWMLALNVTLNLIRKMY